MGSDESSGIDLRVSVRVERLEDGVFTSRLLRLFAPRLGLSPERGADIALLAYDFGARIVRTGRQAEVLLHRMADDDGVWLLVRIFPCGRPLDGRGREALLAGLDPSDAVAAPEVVFVETARDGVLEVLCNFRVDRATPELSGVQTAAQ